MRPFKIIAPALAGLAALSAPTAGAHEHPHHPTKPAAHHAHHAQHAQHAQRAREGGGVRVRHAARAHTSDATATVIRPRPSGRIYFVSPQGNDHNNGLSPTTAWQTVTQVDRTHLQPGDTVRFQGGQTFADNTLMPGWGAPLNGAPGQPIIYGSYGHGHATLPQGIWFKHSSHLAFEDLTLGALTGDAGPGFQGDGQDIGIYNSTIQHADIGINAEGNDWTIANNTIQYTGDSGLLLGYSAYAAGQPAGGDNYLITGNTIRHTGQNPADDYGTHGIYDKVTNSTITNNTITDFNNDAVSVRYHTSTITNNRFTNGDIGIGYFQYDTTPGTSSWTNNKISNVTAAGIFVCGTRESCRQPLESFQIQNNTLTNLAGADPMNLQPTLGHYTL
jgi:hypothetical protein